MQCTFVDEIIKKKNQQADSEKEKTCSFSCSVIYSVFGDNMLFTSESADCVCHRNTNNTDILFCNHFLATTTYKARKDGRSFFFFLTFFGNVIEIVQLS